MQFISCHDGKLQKLESAGLKACPTRNFATGLAEWDALAPRKTFARGAVHELLFEPSHGEPKFVASMLAQAASSNDAFPIIWSDPRGDVYPPALAALGFDLTKTYLLRTDTDADESWAVAECLRCRGVGAVIAAASTMSRIEARRLQLAAERGGAVGILLRPLGRGDNIYAAATRWKVSPAPGERTVQRWTIQLLHGHGGRVGNTLILEWRRESNSVHTVEKLADRSAATKAAERLTA